MTFLGRKSVDSYNKPLLCNSPGKRDNGLFHLAAITGLTQKAYT